MATVQFHFDFASPNAYLSHAVIPEIERRTGASFEYVPILLGGVFKLTNNRSPLEAFAGIRNKLEYDRLETRRFIAQHAIARYRPNPFFPVNTLTLMRGAIAARQLGILAHYVDEMFRHMWEREKKMDDPDVFRSALSDSNIDPEQIMALTRTPAVKAALADTTQRSVDRGTFGTPTFFVEDEIFFGKNSLRDVEQKIAAAAKPA